METAKDIYSILIYLIKETILKKEVDEANFEIKNLKYKEEVLGSFEIKITKID